MILVVLLGRWCMDTVLSTGIAHSHFAEFPTSRAGCVVRRVIIGVGLFTYTQGIAVFPSSEVMSGA